VVSVGEAEVVLMVMGIKELEEQVESLMVLQQLLAEKPLVDKVGRIQEVAEEALGIIKHRGVEAQESFT
jgi:hypothetical protein